MTRSFRESRRQVFLQEAYFLHQVRRRDRMQQLIAIELTAPDTSVHDASLLRATEAEQAYERLSLRYTAGGPIEPLRAELAEVVSAYERYQRALGAYEQVPDIAPLGMGDIGDYERCLQLIGLCYLLHRRDLLPRIAALQDPGYAASDALYEELLDYALADRFDTDLMLHFDPYDPLVHAMYASTDAERIDDLKRYVHSWYPNFRYVPWHDGHKRMGKTDGDYFGYWAFEAGAVALLCEIDDSAVGHLVYPKDLVAWAREHAALSGDAGDADAVLRCEAGAPCPQAGRWTTPAAPGRSRYFAQGEVLPEAVGDYGRTIWRLDLSSLKAEP